MRAGIRGFKAISYWLPGSELQKAGMHACMHACAWRACGKAGGWQVGSKPGPLLPAWVLAVTACAVLASKTRCGDHDHPCRAGVGCWPHNRKRTTFRCCLRQRALARRQCCCWAARPRWESRTASPAVRGERESSEVAPGGAAAAATACHGRAHLAAQPQSDGLDQRAQRPGFRHLVP